MDLATLIDLNLIRPPNAISHSSHAPIDAARKAAILREKFFNSRKLSAADAEPVA